MANEVRLIDANAFKNHLLIGAEFADEDTLLTVLNTLDCEITIDPESLRPKGRWVHNEGYEDWAEKYVCSVCGRNALSDGDYRHNLSDYCPNCGAKMTDNKGEINK